MPQKTALIIGAGPAGLTAACELLDRSGIKPVIFEAESCVGGISRTAVYKGNRLDIGGHRFFSKSKKITDWWLKLLPLESPENDPLKTDLVMLVRNRVSRIFFLQKFFDYPLSLSFSTFRNLGAARVLKISLSYLGSRLLPAKKEKNLEDFFINRFGRELYSIFFRDYTLKVWGRPCREISPEWGAQRIKGLSAAKALYDAAGSLLRKTGFNPGGRTETSLIKNFLYPKLGPGQLWEKAAEKVLRGGGEINLKRRVTGLTRGNGKITGALIKNELDGSVENVKADYFFSTMPVKDLIKAMPEPVPPEVRETAEGLVYRDFITVGLLVKKMKIKDETGIRAEGGPVRDEWIYIQERSVRLGRLQIFNNWSPWLVRDPGTVWLGLEYFCNEDDELWKKTDGELKDFGAGELAGINLIDRADVLDGTVLRLTKVYPAYFGAYGRFGIIRDFTDGFENLFLIGRNGMHRYNNMDQSMLTATLAVENLLAGRKDKENIWSANSEKDYQK